MSIEPDIGAAVVRSMIPERLDRLPWTRPNQAIGAGDE
jgi:hypothetical protein